MKANSSRLLIDEQPLQVLPTLARLIGLNEAIVLQQVHFWLKINETNEHRRSPTDRPHFKEGRWWTYNTYTEWRDQFPFWSEPTIKRAVLSAENRRLLISEQFDLPRWDHRKWYSIDYDALNSMLSSGSNSAARADQNDPLEGGQSDPSERYQVDPSLIDESEITSEITTENGADTPPASRLSVEERKKRTRQALERGLQRHEAGEADLSWLDEDLWALGRTFIAETGLHPINSDHTYWRKSLRQQHDAGLTPTNLVSAIQQMRADQLTIADPGSVTKTARSLAASNASTRKLSPLQAAAQRDPSLREYRNITRERLGQPK